MLARARRVGVRRFLSVGVDEASSAAAVRLAARSRGIMAAVGLHPALVWGHELQTTMAHFRELAQSPGVAAIGEVGLDATAEAPLELQERFFAVFLALAEELDLAVVLHVVGAHQRAQAMLAAHRTRRAVVHYFQGDATLGDSYLALGCFISVGKPVTRPDQQALREAVRGIPLERMLLETDAYPLLGRTTEPRDIVTVCEAVAELKGTSWAAVAEATTANYRHLFLQRPAN